MVVCLLIAKGQCLPIGEDDAERGPQGC